MNSYIQKFKKILFKSYEIVAPFYIQRDKSAQLAKIAVESMGKESAGARNFLCLMNEFEKWGYQIIKSPKSYKSFDFLIIRLGSIDEKLDFICKKIESNRNATLKVIVYFYEPLTNMQNHFLDRLFRHADALCVDTLGFGCVGDSNDYVHLHSHKTVLIQDPILDGIHENLARKVHNGNNPIGVWHGYGMNLDRWVYGRWPHDERHLGKFLKSKYRDNYSKEILMNAKNEVLGDPRFYGDLREVLPIPLETICGYNSEFSCANLHPGDKAIGRYIQRYDIGIAPFYTGSDRCIVKPFGTKIQTYIMAGLPVIASPIPDYQRWLEHGKTCLFAETKAEWKDAAYKLKDPDFRQEISDNARSMVLSNFNMAHIISMYEMLFNALRKNKPFPFLLKDQLKRRNFKECVNE